MAKRSELATTDSVPSLRSALWLYFLVLLGTAWITISLSNSIEPLFIRFAVASFVVLGFTFAACRLLRVSVSGLFGETPQLTGLVLSTLLGAALFFPAQWLSFITQLFLDNSIGLLPPPLSSPSTTQFGYLVQFGLIIPLCYALLFWGFMHRAAEGVFNVRGVILVAILFGLYGIFMTDLALSAVPGFLIVGLCAALTVYWTKSLWYGFAVNAGFNLAYVSLQSPLLNFLRDDLHNPFSIRWLMAVIVLGFVAFILFQVIRFRSSITTQPTIQPIVSQRKLWWVPLLLIAAVYLFIVIGEIVLRSQQPVQRPATNNTTAPVAPPVGATSQAP